MEENNLEQLKEKYMGTPIPPELDFRVRKALKEGRVNRMRKKGFIRGLKTAGTAAAALVVLTIGLNTSPALARNLARVPVVGNLVKVLTFKEYVVDEGNYSASIKVPEISGLQDEKLQSSLNQKYLQENEELYKQFMTDIEEMRQSGTEGHMGVDSGYIIKTDTDQILSIGRYVLNIVGSSSTVFKFDTIDKKNEILLTLPSLFKDNSYVEAISANIKEQMLKQHEEDEAIYWLEGAVNEDGAEFVDMFENISEEQSFYITSDNKLVIAFDKYEVAPGYMGNPEFVIPTEIIADILVGNEYIK